MTWQEDQLPDWAKKERQESQAEIERLRAVLADIAGAKEPPENNPQPDDLDWRFSALEMKRVAALALAGAYEQTTVTGPPDDYTDQLREAVGGLMGGWPPGEDPEQQK